MWDVGAKFGLEYCESLTWPLLGVEWQEEVVQNMPASEVDREKAVYPHLHTYKGSEVGWERGICQRGDARRE